MPSPHASASHRVEPRVIIHGGAGNVTRENLPPALWRAHRDSLLRILHSTRHLLIKDRASAIDAAAHAVRLLENDPLFNAGRGAVFTQDGKIELEASMMVSKGLRKRGVGVMRLKHVKSPITLAAEMLKRGEDENGDGAQQHVQIVGETAEHLAESWKLDMVDESYFWTKKRWEEHQRKLNPTDSSDIGPQGPHWDVGDPSWDGKEYLPQGTVGCVVLDHSGTLAVATSTGGITNKLPGRIGDTPTLGAGYWSEEWLTPVNLQQSIPLPRTWPMQILQNVGNLDPTGLVNRWILPRPVIEWRDEKTEGGRTQHRAAAVSGTGNGDSFLRVAAAHTAVANCRFSSHPMVRLGTAVAAMAGPHGELQQLAGDRWGVTGEGEGGMIGIELCNGESHVAFDFNCGGMFRAWFDDAGRAHCMVFRDDYEKA